MEKALILSADIWEMADERTGEVRTGCSVWYVTNYRTDDGRAQGMKPAKVSGSVELFKELSGKLPAEGYMAFGSRPGREGKAQLTLVGAQDLKPIKLFS